MKNAPAALEYTFSPPVGSWRSDGQLKSSDLCQFYLDFQGHEVGLGLGAGIG